MKNKILQNEVNGENQSVDSKKSKRNRKADTKSVSGDVINEVTSETAKASEKSVTGDAISEVASDKAKASEKSVNSDEISEVASEKAKVENSEGESDISANSQGNEILDSDSSETGKSKRRKSLKSVFKILLDTDITKQQLEKLSKGVCDFPIYENSIKVSEAIAISQIIKAIGGDMKAFELIRDVTGETNDKKSSSKGFRIVIQDM